MATPKKTVKKLPRIPYEHEFPEGRGYLYKVQPTLPEAEADVKYIKKWFIDNKPRIVPIKQPGSEKICAYAVYSVR